MQKKKKIDFAIIGPENPLANGVADALFDIGVESVGPKKDLLRRLRPLNHLQEIF